MIRDLVDGLSGRLPRVLTDRYRISREIGRGGSAVVYLAEDLKHDRLVALKVVVPELAESVRKDRFLREIQIAAKLAHPHIVPLYDSGDADSTLYYVMPYITGESLREWLSRDGQLPLDEALRITREVASALAYAHGEGIVHRDIKPENILLQGGVALVADFGIARALLEAHTTGGLTKAGIAVGTPHYMSPEQSTGEQKVDARSDVYGLACVLYEMLAGHPPFTGSSATEILSRHALDPVPRLTAARPDVPQHVDAALRKALAKAPADRFSTAADFAAALTGTSARLVSGDLSPVTGSTRIRRALQPGVLTAGVAVLAAAVASGLVLQNEREEKAAAKDVAVAVARPSEKSIAVLPFENLSADSAQESFSEGMTEELINALSRVEGLRVPGRTSSYAFHRKEVPLATIGEALKVATVLEGTVRTSGSRLRVSARLVNVSDGYQVWSDIYERDLKDVFAVQDEITRAIVQALQVKLTRVSARTESVEAYQLYLMGRFFYNKGTGAGVERAREFFSEAIAKDPDYALAYAGLADAYDRLINLRLFTRADGYPRARAAGLKAVQLDPQLAEGYVSRARTRHRFEWNWTGAEEDFRRAIALNPGYALGHLWYGQLLAQQGRFDEAIREARRAAELDPLSAQVMSVYASVLYNARQYRAATEQARKSLELEPANAEAHQRLADYYLLQQKYAEALQEYQTALDLLAGRGRVADYRARIGIVYARSGRRAEAVRILNELESSLAKRTNQRGDFAVSLAQLHGELGNRDRAFELLEEAFQGHESLLVTAKVSPFFDSLRSDPRFRVLLRKVGLLN